MKFGKLFSATLFAAFVFATAIVRAAGTDSAAQAWESLTNFSLSPPPMSWQTNTPTQADLDKFDDQRAVESATLADKARDFYTRFPNNTNVLAAQITEIQALQMAVHLGETNRAGDLAEREQTMIDNTNVPMEARYELRVDQIGRELKSDTASGENVDAAMEKAGRELLKEFPAEPMGYELLLNVAESSDLMTMHDLAELMATNSGPPQLTQLGKGLLNQLNVVGQKMPIDFMADGKEINATTLSNKVVLVDFWATWCPICVQEMPDLKKLYDQFHANGFEIVGINFDDDTNQAQKFIKQNDMPWPQYFGGYGADNQYGVKYGEALPYLWLVDKKGIIQDIHGRENTEAKIEKLLAK